MVEDLKSISSVSFKLLDLKQEHPSKNCFFFWRNPYTIEVLNSSHRNAKDTKFWSQDHIYNIIWFTSYNFVVVAMNRNSDVMNFISKISSVAHFAGIIKIGTMFIKTNFKDSKK